MKFKTQSGVEVEINIAPFKDAMNLKNAIGKELAKTGIDLKNIDINSDISEITNILLSVDCSEEVHRAALKCLERSLYDGFKITESIFDEERARGDYYEIIIECLKINIAPFFKGLFSKLKNLQAPTQEENRK